MKECNHQWIPLVLEPRNGELKLWSYTYITVRVKCVECGEERDIE